MITCQIHNCSMQLSATLSWLVDAASDQHLKCFVLLDWASERVTGVRDFVFARYAMDGAELVVMD